MKFKVIFTIAFSAALSSFSAFSALKTFVIPDKDAIEVVEDEAAFDDSKFVQPIEDPKEDPKEEPKEEQPTTDPVEEPEEPVDPPGTDPVEDPEEPEDPTELKFTDEVVIKDEYYTSPEMILQFSTETIKTKNMQNKSQLMDTFVYTVDIKLKSLSHLRTAFAKDQFGRNIEEKTSVIAARKGAVLAVNGDFYGKQDRGYVVRNGTVYRSTQTTTYNKGVDLAINYDATFTIFKEKTHTLQEMVDAGAYQVFSFGPALVNNVDGTPSVQVNENAEVNSFSNNGNQRVSIGIIEPLHYVICVNDARITGSYGMSLYEMGSYMLSKGCVKAYNLDGGGSATLYYNGKVINRPAATGDVDVGVEREISDIVYFK